MGIIGVIGGSIIPIIPSFSAFRSTIAVRDR